MALLKIDTSQYHGKTVVRFEDEYGHELDTLYMCFSLVIVFSDGDRIVMKQDWRGDECYFSQHEKDGKCTEKQLVGQCDYCLQVKPLLGQNHYGMRYCGDPCWTRTHPYTQRDNGPKQRSQQ